MKHWGYTIAFLLTAACRIYAKPISNIDEFLNLINAGGGDGLETVAEQCGRSRYHEHHRTSHALGKRIVGGQEAQFGEWPWLVSMMLKKENSSTFEHLCGGTLVAPQWVVSAAHCFEPVWAEFLSPDPGSWMVRIGEHNLFDEQAHHVDVPPEKILFHPLRNAPEKYNVDIALVKLSHPVKLNSYVNVACLPHADDRPPTGSLCVTAGWGHQQENGNVSSVVRHVEVPIVSNKLCNKMYAELAHIVQLEIPPDMMCAGFDQGGRDACQYDSGGPMVCFDRKDDTWLFSGVVSVGYGCARSGFPGIYTRVPAFVDWIQESISIY